MTQSASKKTKKPIRVRGGRAVTIGLFLILIAGSIGIGYFANVSKPDLNADVPIVNSERYDIWNGTNRVLWMSRVVNATSTYSEHVWFWVNTSQYVPTSIVCFKYFNGTHGEHYNASESIDDRFWNYRQWWTDYWFYSSEQFNATFLQDVAFTIPQQKGNTEVVYQLTVVVWNGSGLEYNDYNGTYVVRYSDYEVLYEQNVYVTTGLYWASHPILVGLIFIAWRGHRPEKQARTEPKQRKDEEKHHLDEHSLVARSNHLDDTIGRLRMGASVLFGIGTGATLWLGNVSAPFQGYLWMGLVILALCSFTGIVITFASAEVESYGFELKRGLVPEGQTLDEYKAQLKQVIERKEGIIESIEGFVGAGLVYLATFLLMGFIVGFFPASNILGDRIWSMVPVWISLGLAFLDALAWSAVVLGSRGLGVLD